MTKLTLSTILSSIILLSTSSAWAGSNQHQINNMHNLAKRPFQQVVLVSASQSDEAWVGAGVNSTTLETSQQQKQFRLHMLGKRPFM